MGEEEQKTKGFSTSKSNDFEETKKEGKTPVEKFLDKKISRNLFIYYSINTM